MPLIETKGAASAQGFGLTLQQAAANYIEDVFSAYLYTGTGLARTITNGIDLSTYGGLVWIKSRSAGYNNLLTDTSRGATQTLFSNLTNAQTAIGQGVQSFGSTGFNIGNYAPLNAGTQTFVSWTFRKQPKFFDVVTYTGNGANRTISHNLGSVPGCIIVKRTDSADDWQVYHRSLANTEYMVLNSTATKATGTTRWNSTTPTSTVFSVGTDATVNASGGTYVAYLFAHNAGGFGLSGTDNVISCGSYTTNAGGSATINLGWEPQFWMRKVVTGTNGLDWKIVDVMRNFSYSAPTLTELYPNTNNVEGSWNGGSPTATGISVSDYASQTYIYIAIRRGPMKTPTSGTSVFYPQAISQADSIDSTGVPFPPDLVNTFSRNGTDRTSFFDLFQFVDRLRGLGVPSDTYANANEGLGLLSSSTAVEYGKGSLGSTVVQLKSDGQNITRGTGWNSSTYGNWIYYFMRRAPGFMDVVCYTGTGATRTVTHNLGAVPELMIVKSRGSAVNWAVYTQATGASNWMSLNTASASGPGTSVWNATTPTSSVFTVGASTSTNANSINYVAYLFSTVAGVSKVGSYTGTGTTLQIDCGFTGGARFVMIKRTNSTGDWYVWDSARGIVAGNDPYLLLNSTAVEVTSTDYVDTYSAGFEISSTAPAAINANGGTFIFLAIA